MIGLFKVESEQKSLKNSNLITDIKYQASIDKRESSGLESLTSPAKRINDMSPKTSNLKIIHVRDQFKQKEMKFERNLYEISGDLNYSEKKLNKIENLNVVRFQRDNQQYGLLSDRILHSDKKEEKQSPSRKRIKIDLNTYKTSSNIFTQSKEIDLSEEMKLQPPLVMNSITEKIVTRKKSIKDLNKLTKGRKKESSLQFSNLQNEEVLEENLNYNFQSLNSQVDPKLSSYKEVFSEFNSNKKQKDEINSYALNQNKIGTGFDHGVKIKEDEKFIVPETIFSDRQKIILQNLDITQSKVGKRSNSNPNVDLLLDRAPKPPTRFFEPGRADIEEIQEAKISLISKEENDDPVDKNIIWSKQNTIEARNNIL